MVLSAEAVESLAQFGLDSELNEITTQHVILKYHIGAQHYHLASQGFWCRQPTGIGDNGIWRIAKRNGILYLPDVGSKTTSFFSASAGISASS